MYDISPTIMSRRFYNSRIEVLSSAQINKLDECGRHLIQIMPYNTYGYSVVEHVDKEDLLNNKLQPVKGEKKYYGHDQWADDQDWH